MFFFFLLFPHRIRALGYSVVESHGIELAAMIDVVTSTHAKLALHESVLLERFRAVRLVCCEVLVDLALTTLVLILHLIRV